MKTEIDYLNVKETDGYTWAHAVVTVGYEHFVQNYIVVEEYWLFGWRTRLVEKQNHYYYLRCIDGWNTSNSSQFVDFNGFYGTIMGTSFSLKDA